MNQSEGKAGKAFQHPPTNSTIVLSGPASVMVSRCTRRAPPSISTGRGATRVTLVLSWGEGITCTAAQLFVEQRGVTLLSTVHFSLGLRGLEIGSDKRPQACMLICTISQTALICRIWLQLSKLS